MEPPTQTITIQDVPIPEPAPNQFLIKIASTSFCHSDLMSIEANNAVTLGHEGAGFVEAMHPSVANCGFAVGDKVGFLCVFGACFECEGCRVHNL